MIKDQIHPTKLINLSIDTIRTLSMDAVQKANSGHPGTPMALAPAAYVLWTRIMKHNPANSLWFDRDRFILSNGHASMLLYSMLYLTGYKVSLEDLKNFRQWGSNTPGHPEYLHTDGVETTTGPLGQGIGNAVGMAMAEAHLASKFNRHGHQIVDHHTFVFCSDGDLMEGISHEAASVAGHLGLGKLIFLYDDNHITIEGETELSYSDDAAKRFEAYHWHVQDLGDQGNDLEAIEKAFREAKAVADRPSLIILRTHIGYGAPTLQDTPEAHGSPLGEEEIRRTKKNYDWPSQEPFFVPEQVLEHMQEVIKKGKEQEADWNEKFENYKKEYPELAEGFENALKQELPSDWDAAIPKYTPADGAKATRSINSDVLNAIADKLPWLIGGSADLSPSTKTLFKKEPYMSQENPAGRNIAWGIRELGMCAASSGLQLHGGVRPFAATFFVFTDYARPAIRLAALMKLPVIYVMTHDSIGLGEDGPTHQPIEHLASLRAMPDLTVIRPADANEATYAWRAAIQRTKGPSVLVMTRQNLPTLDGRKITDTSGALKGAYIISREDKENIDLILMGTGSEVHLLIQAQEQLEKENLSVRVVSMPSWEIFEEQPKEYRSEVLPEGVTARLAVEAASPFGWRQWVGDRGAVIGIDRFGASAPYEEIYKHFGFTPDNIAKVAKKLLD